MFPINIYVNFFWNIYDDFCFSGLMIKLKSNSMFILLDEYGDVEDVSKNYL